METTSGHKVEQIGQRSHADPAVRFLQSLTAPQGRARPPPRAWGLGPAPVGGGGGNPGLGQARRQLNPGLVIPPPSSPRARPPAEALPGNPWTWHSPSLGGRVIRDNMRGRGRTPGRAGKSLKSGAACSRGSRSQEPPSAPAVPSGAAARRGPGSVRGKGGPTPSGNPQGWFGS